jgi:hypothetical protein
MTIVKSEYKVFHKDGEITTTLKAKLKYPKNVSDSDKKNLHSRVDYDDFEDYDERYYFGKEDLGTYLVDNDINPRTTREFNARLRILNFYKFVNNYKNKIEYFFSPSFNKSGLNVIAKAKGEIPREDIINLEELDSFIRGDYSYKKEWNHVNFKK